MEAYIIKRLELTKLRQRRIKKFWLRHKESGLIGFSEFSDFVRREGHKSKKEILTELIQIYENKDSKILIQPLDIITTLKGIRGDYKGKHERKEVNNEQKRV